MTYDLKLPDNIFLPYKEILNMPVGEKGIYGGFTWGDAFIDSLENYHNGIRPIMINGDLVQYQFVVTEKRRTYKRNIPKRYNEFLSDIFRNSITFQLKPDNERRGMAWFTWYGYNYKKIAEISHEEKLKLIYDKVMRGYNSPHYKVILDNYGISLGDDETFKGFIKDYNEIKKIDIMIYNRELDKWFSIDSINESV